MKLKLIFGRIFPHLMFLTTSEAKESILNGVSKPMCQSVIFGSLTLSNNKMIVLGELDFFKNSN